MTFSKTDADTTLIVTVSEDFDKSISYGGLIV